MGTEILGFMFTIDTNILIYYVAGDKQAADFLLKQISSGAVLIIPTIVVAEFLSFPGLKAKEQTFFANLLGQLQIEPLSFEIAQKAGGIRRKYKITLPDAIVAATALQTKTTLLTRNIKHFGRVKEIRVQSP